MNLTTTEHSTANGGATPCHGDHVCYFVSAMIWEHCRYPLFSVPWQSEEIDREFVWRDYRISFCLVLCLFTKRSRFSEDIWYNYVNCFRERTMK